MININNAIVVTSFGFSTSQHTLRLVNFIVTVISDQLKQPLQDVYMPTSVTLGRLKFVLTYGYGFSGESLSTVQGIRISVHLPIIHGQWSQIQYCLILLYVPSPSQKHSEDHLELNSNSISLSANFYFFFVHTLDPLIHRPSNLHALCNHYVNGGSGGCMNFRLNCG